MKINKIEAKDYRGTPTTGNKNNRIAYFDNSLWIIKTNKLKKHNSPESKLTAHRQTVLSEMFASTLLEQLDIIPVQHTELGINENDEICVCCEDFRRNEIIVEVDSKSSRETANEKEFVNDFDNYYKNVIIPRVEYNNIKDSLTGDFYKYLTVFDFIIANPDRHLGNIAYLISTESGDTRIAPAYDFGAGLGSNIRIDRSIVDILKDKDIDNINKCMQNFCGIHPNIQSLKSRELPNWFYDYASKIVNTDIIEKSNRICEHLINTNLFDKERVLLAFKIIEYRVELLRKNNGSIMDSIINEYK